MSTHEELREALVNLERARDKEQNLRIETEGLLDGLRVLTRSEDTQEAFVALLTIIREQIGFDDAFVLGAENDQELVIISATDDRFAEILWPIEGPFKQALCGRAINLFDVSRIPGWKDLPDHVLDGIQSALHLRIEMLDSHALLICVSRQPAFFKRAHVKLIQRFTLLAQQACQSLENRRQLQASQDELAQARKLEAIGQLAAGIAHEINTPMQYVGDNTSFLLDCFEDLGPILKMGNDLAELVNNGGECAELAKEFILATEEVDVEYLSEEIPRAINQTLDGITRVRKIVQSMKEFSHPGVEKLTPIDLNHAIENTITVATHEWKYVATVETHFGTELQQVPCLPGEFNQVILNMIVNAAHAIANFLGDDHSEKGKITISTSQKDEFAEIRISDTGTGIPEHSCDRVFDPFFTTKDVGKGTGQGLSIAYNIIVNKHSGSIDFETELGKGTTFIIWLPLQSTTSEEE